jgi:Tat protein translocase TatB subunit
MSFFGMGAWEITIILIAALVIFGPNRLPEIAGKVGKTVRDLRQMSAELTGEFERTAGVQELKKAVQGEISGIKSEVNSVTSSVKRDLGSAGSAASATASSAKSTTTTTTSSTSAAKTTPKSGTSSAKPAGAAIEPPKASKKDPLADVSFLEETAPIATAARAAASNGTTSESAKASTSAKTNTATVGPSADQVDALTRARQRRLSAGYNHRPG